MDNLLLICRPHHRAVHEVGFTINGLGEGRFEFHRPDGVRLPETRPHVEAAAEHSARPDIDATTIAPTWGGERLDIGLLVSALAANAINGAGHNLMDVADADLPATLRAAVRWPYDHPPTTAA